MTCNIGGKASPATKKNHVDARIINQDQQTSSSGALQPASTNKTGCLYLLHNLKVNMSEHKIST